MPKGGFAARRAKRKIAMLEKEEDDELASSDSGADDSDQVSDGAESQEDSEQGSEVCTK